MKIKHRHKDDAADEVLEQLRKLVGEHVIPHKIKQEEWERDRTQYRKFPQLSDINLQVV